MKVLWIAVAAVLLNRASLQAMADTQPRDLKCKKRGCCAVSG